MLEILQTAGIETMRTGNSDVCRYCPDCHPIGEHIKKGNHTAQVNDETLYCFTCGKTWTRTEIIERLELWNILDIPKFVEKDEFKRQQADQARRIEYKTSAEPAKPQETKEIERLLSLEIPKILWNFNAESFKNISLTKWNKENRLLFKLASGTTITRNAGNIKWKWGGKQPIFNRITDKKLIFFASGVAEWLIFDWLGLDYIVLPSDSMKGRIAEFKEHLQNKAVIILPDYDQSGSFDKVIEIVKQIAERVHICNFYNDKDFRDYARRTAPAFENKEQFMDSLFYNIFIEAGGSESAEIITENDIFSLISVMPIIQAETEPEKQETQEHKLPEPLDNLLFFIKPAPQNFIFKSYKEKTVGIFGGTGGMGKSLTALMLAIGFADNSKRINPFNLLGNMRGKCGYISNEDDSQELQRRIYNIFQYYKVNKNNELLNNFKAVSFYGYNFKLIIKKNNNYEINLKNYNYLLNFCAGKQLVILDTFRRLHGLKENDDADMAEITELIEKISYQTKCAILIVGHVRKGDKDNNDNGKDKIKGSAVITDNTRFTMLLDSYKENKKTIKGKALLTCEKANYAEKFDDIVLEWQKFTILDDNYNYSMLIDIDDTKTQNNNINEDIIYENEYEKAGF